MNKFSMRKLTLEVSLFFLVLAGLLGAWSSLAPLSSATMALGHVAVEGHRKKVVPLEAGIVQHIFVKENQRVRKGQILLEFNSEESQQKLVETHKQLLRVNLDIARFEALATQSTMENGYAQVASMQKEGTNAQWAFSKQLQRSQLKNYLQKQRVMDQEVKQLKTAMQWDTTVVDQMRKKLLVLQTQYLNIKQLVLKNFATEQELNTLHIKITNVLTEMITKEAGIANQQLAIVALKLNKEAQSTAFYNANLEQINALNSQKWQLEQRVNSLNLKVTRARVLAPVAGSIINLQVHTQGEAISSGAYLMDIVPRKAPLVIEAELAAQDIDLVKAGNGARVRLTSYNQRHLNPLEARVTQVSADRFQDKQGADVFRLLLEVDAQALARQPEIKLYPGMPVQALILGKERTLMNYLLTPVLAGVERSLRE